MASVAQALVHMHAQGLTPGCFGSSAIFVAKYSEGKVFPRLSCFRLKDTDGDKTKIAAVSVGLKSVAFL